MTNDVVDKIADALVGDHVDLLLENKRLREALQQVMEVDNDMGIYPAAVQGYNDERDYTQRDGYMNGWNACAMEFTQKVYAIAYDALEPKEQQ